jgi:hypothetical protein
VGGGTDLVATFALHRLMISSALKAMNSWSMTLLKEMPDGMPQLGIGLSKTAQPVAKGDPRAWMLPGTNTRSMSELPPTVSSGKRFRLTSRIRQGRLSVLGKIKVELLDSD